MIIGKKYKNVVGSIGIDKRDRIAVGALYNVARAIMIMEYPA